MKKNNECVHGIFQSHWSSTKEVHLMECSRFDSFINNYSLPIPDLVKIDVEGASYQVIEGFGDTIKKVKVIQIETETQDLFYGQKLQNEVFEFLNNNNFKEIYQMKCCEGQYDSIFINENYKKWLTE